MGSLEQGRENGGSISGSIDMCVYIYFTAVISDVSGSAGGAGYKKCHKAQCQTILSHTSFKRGFNGNIITFTTVTFRQFLPRPFARSYYSTARVKKRGRGFLTPDWAAPLRYGEGTAASDPPADRRVKVFFFSSCHAFALGGRFVFRACDSAAACPRGRLPATEAARHR